MKNYIVLDADEINPIIKKITTSIEGSKVTNAVYAMLYIMTIYHNQEKDISTEEFKESICEIIDSIQKTIDNNNQDKQ